MPSYVSKFLCLKVTGCPISSASSCLLSLISSSDRLHPVSIATTTEVCSLLQHLEMCPRIGEMLEVVCYDEGFSVGSLEIFSLGMYESESTGAGGSSFQLLLKLLI